METLLGIVAVLALLAGLAWLAVKVIAPRFRGGGNPAPRSDAPRSDAPRYSKRR